MILLVIFTTCRGFDDKIDSDNDSIPDGCDDLIDSDFDGVEDILDLCPNSSQSNGLESNLDGCDFSRSIRMMIINDYEDRCQGFDDKFDNNSNQIPDGCEEVSEVTEEENLEKTTRVNFTT